MKKYAINMFQVPPLMVFDYEGDINKLLEYFSNIEYIKGCSAQLPLSSRSKNDYILDDENLKDLKQFCLNSVYEYVNEVIGVNDEIEIHQSWVNLNKPGEHLQEHYHPNSFISGVLYLSSDPEKGAPISFKSELHKSNFSVQNVPKEQTAYYPCTSASFDYPSLPGQLILFSSTTSHFVPTNFSDKDRISLSFNTYPKIPFGNRVGQAYIRG